LAVKKKNLKIITILENSDSKEAKESQTNCIIA